VILFENQVAPARGCVPADRKTVREIGKNPERYYLNVVNDEFPVGAVRGQLAPPPRSNLGCEPTEPSLLAGVVLFSPSRACAEMIFA